MCQLSPSNYPQVDPRPAGLIWTLLSIISWMYCLGGSVILCSKWIIPISAQSPAVLARFICHHHLQAPNAVRVGWQTGNYGDSPQMFAWANSPDFLGTKHLILFGYRLFIYVPQAVILLLCLGKKAYQYQNSPDFFFSPLYRWRSSGHDIFRVGIAAVKCTQPTICWSFSDSNWVFSLFLPPPWGSRQVNVGIGSLLWNLQWGCLLLHQSLWTSQCL